MLCLLKRILFKTQYDMTAVGLFETVSKKEEEEAEKEEAEEEE